MSLLFRPLSERGIELCSKGLHEMEGDNVGIKRRGPGKNATRTCRACNRANTLRHRTEQRSTQKPLNPVHSREQFTCERWEEGGHLYVRVSAERFEYATFEDYSLKARRHLGPHVRKTGWQRPSSTSTWLEEVERDRDYANPEWAHSVTFRTIAPVLLAQPDHDAAA